VCLAIHGQIVEGAGRARRASEGLADHFVITRSQHIPRIQEAQASAYHVLCELAR
jgi:D-sedoheptulose 7-phosphate isomerase